MANPAQMPGGDEDDMVDDELYDANQEDEYNIPDDSVVNSLG